MVSSGLTPVKKIVKVYENGGKEAMNIVLLNLKILNKRIADKTLVTSGFLVAVIAAVVAAGIFWRYVLNDSLS